MKLLLLSKYDDKGASSRVRSFQYLPFLREQGMTVTVSSLFSNDYLNALYNGHSTWKQVVTGYFRRLLKLCSVGEYDLLIIEKEIFPFMPAFFERLLSFSGVPYLVDYDDALFHRYDCHKSALIRFFLGKKIDIVMKNAAVVIAGNHYLAQRAEKAGAKKVVIIPTVVDTEKYSSVKRSSDEGLITIGWIGTPKTSHYLMPLLPVFERLKKELNVRFVAIGPNQEDFAGSSVEIWPWSENTEVTSIQKLDIGIMPLDDSPWERGKCGYKLIQYMACGVPVIASPVGVNEKIVKNEVNGLLVSTEEEWETALSELATSAERRATMGKAARETIEKKYSLNAQKERLLPIIMSFNKPKTQKS